MDSETDAVRSVCTGAEVALLAEVSAANGFWELPIPVTKEERARMAQSEDVGDLIRYVACLPPHIVINEVMINPTWNRRYVADLQRGKA